MSQILSYGAIWSGFSRIDSFVLMLDFAAWVNKEFDGEPSTTSISLVDEPKAEFCAKVDVYLAEHRSELAHRRLKCPVCGDEYFATSGYTTCPTERAQFERVFKPGTGLSPYKKCNTPLVEIFFIGDSEQVLRERAEHALARQGDIVSRRYVACAWLTQKLHPGNRVPVGDVCSSLQDVQKQVTEMMEKDVDRLTHKLSQLDDPLHLSGRRDLWPDGGTLQERHADYESVRGKLISSYHRLAGFTVGHPEFAELDEEHTRPREFAPPIPLSIEQVRLPRDEVAPLPSPDDTSQLSCADIAERFNLPKDALRKRLARFIRSNDDCYSEVDAAQLKPRESKYRYYLGKVRPVIAEMRASAERPPKKT